MAEVAGNPGRGMGKRLLIWTAALLLAACASLGSQSPEQEVKARAQARWDALVQGDFKAAYGYLSPGSRVVLPEKEYVNSLRRDFWKSAKVDQATCSDKRCQVDVTIEYEFRGHRTTTPLKEVWIREGSDWWYVQRS